VALLAAFSWGLYYFDPQRTEVAAPADYTPPATSVMPAEPTAVSVLSDSHAFNEGSWLRRTIPAGAIPNVGLAAFASQPGADSETLAAKLDEAATGAGFVLVQAGTNDLLVGDSPEQAAAGVEALLQGVRDRGATPIVVLVPPSDTRASRTVTLNGLLRDYATQNGLGVLDVYSAVANPDGTWKTGLSGDGIHASGQGPELMAQATLGQLPELLGHPGA
jgi:lysophospholipase L1-like esterase